MAERKDPMRDASSRRRENEQKDLEVETATGSVRWRLSSRRGASGRRSRTSARRRASTDGEQRSGGLAPAAPGDPGDPLPEG